MGARKTPPEASADCEAILQANFPSARRFCARCGGYEPTECELRALVRAGVEIAPLTDAERLELQRQRGVIRQIPWPHQNPPQPV